MGIKIQAGATRGSIARIRKELDGIQTWLDDLRYETRVLQGLWNGDARDAFASSMARAQSSLDGLRAAAESAAAQADSTIESFEIFDRRRASVWHL
ncbi:WXG100 family type VII secretion target [Mycetocola spongiae]|uniref:WXG100 family type VII secretion target n=1 Tax=Mycetocola spongiae TaxID=2859226 RepID=UPI001CF270E5|nr:WXG100 family type VII secretion target [Mycetocola spongiae]